MTNGAWLVSAGIAVLLLGVWLPRSGAPLGHSPEVVVYPSVVGTPVDGIMEGRLSVVCGFTCRSLLSFADTFSSIFSIEFSFSQDSMELVDSCPVFMLAGHIWFVVTTPSAIRLTMLR